MSKKIASLGVEISADTGKLIRPIEKAKKSMSGFGRHARNQRGAMARLNKTFVGLAGPITGLVGAYAGLTTVFSNLRTFENLNSRLATATGNSTNAKLAMDALKNTVTELPFSLEQVTDSFIKLKNFGLDASEDAIKSYAATSAALGKDLDQLIEAVADSAVGEFERLKEFGILTRRQGDQIAFTFKGTTTTVENSSRAIQDFLINMGQTEFSEGLANQMDTLDSSLVNLSDAFFRLTTSILGTDAIKGMVQDLTGVLNDVEINLVANKFNAEIRKAGEEAGGGFLEGIKEVVNLGTIREAELLLQNLENRVTEVRENLNKPVAKGGRLGVGEAVRENSEALQNSTKAHAKALGERIDLLKREASANAELQRQTERQQRIQQGRVVTEQAMKRISDELLPPAEKLKVLQQEQAELLRKIQVGEQINLNAAENKVVELGKQMNSLKEKMNQAKKIGQQFTNSLAEGLARGIVRGGDLLGVLRSVVEQLAVDDLTNLLKSAFQGKGETSAIGGLFSGVKKLFGGPMADGGPVSMGKSYLVGERGPELFTPRGSGTISPNGSFGGMTVNNYFDIRGSDDEIQRQIAASVDMAVSMSVGKMQDLRSRGAIA